MFLLSFRIAVMAIVTLTFVVLQGVNKAGGTAVLWDSCYGSRHSNGIKLSVSAYVSVHIRSISC